MARPVDPDTAPAHTRPGLLGLVALGGAVGTAVRYAVSQALPTPGGWPLATWSVNLVGAFVLGLMLESLARRGPDLGVRRRLRLLLGTGFCGGLTTYSTFAVEVVELVGQHRVGLGIAYALGSVVVGAAFTAAGVWVGSRRARSTGATP